MFLHRFKLRLDLFSFNLFTATNAVIDTSENKQIFYSTRTKHAWVWQLHKAASLVSCLFIVACDLVGSGVEKSPLCMGTAPAFAVLPPCRPPPPLTPKNSAEVGLKWCAGHVLASCLGYHPQRRNGAELTPVLNAQPHEGAFPSPPRGW